MRCPHLIKWVTFSCKAKDKLYFPSPFQLHEYCNRKDHKKCPFYLKVHQNEYLEGVYFQGSL